MRYVETDANGLILHICERMGFSDTATPDKEAVKQVRAMSEAKGNTFIELDPSELFPHVSEEKWDHQTKKFRKLTEQEKKDRNTTP